MQSDTQKEETHVSFFVSVRPAAARGWQPTPYETYIQYYNANQQPVGWELYGCGDTYDSHGTLSGSWMVETDTNCCTRQQNGGVFYFCSNDRIWHQVAYVADTNCP